MSSTTQETNFPSSRPDDVELFLRVYEVASAVATGRARIRFLSMAKMIARNI